MSGDLIRDAIAARAAAINAHNVEDALAAIADDVSIYELVPPLCTSGIAAARKRMIEWFGSYRDGPRWEDGEISVILGSDVAISHSLSHVTGTATSGDEVDMWFRCSLGWQERDGEWKVVHQHISVPFDPETGKGRLDLKPPR